MFVSQQKIIIIIIIHAISSYEITALGFYSSGRIEVFSQSVGKCIMAGKCTSLMEIKRHCKGIQEQSQEYKLLEI